MIVIHAGQVLTPLKRISPGTILIEGEKILAVGYPTEVQIPPGTPVIDAAERIVVPGFIDTHIHGRDGSYFGEDPENSAELCRNIANTGVTSLSHPRHA
jgi:N-acetylglucosamine-6-phosphate deacetylase